MDLYRECVEAGIPTDHHESDLYVKGTPEAIELVKKSGLQYTTFVSPIDGHEWIDVPFSYTPFWEKNGTEI